MFVLVNSGRSFLKTFLLAELDPENLDLVSRVESDPIYLARHNQHVLHLEVRYSVEVVAHYPILGLCVIKDTETNLNARDIWLSSENSEYSQ